MNQSGEQRDEAERSDRRPEGATPASTRGEPRDALDRRDDAHREGQPGHRRQYARLGHGWLGRGWLGRGWRGDGWLGPTVVGLVVACVIATIAHAADGTPSGELTVTAAIVLGVIQGITEFLPISSDGHLALAGILLGLEGGAGGHRFTIVVHAGTLLAVVWTYRTDLVALTKAALRPTAQSEDRRLLLAMLVASLPLGFAVAPGVKEAIIAMESEVRWVGVWLWVSALALFLGFRHERHNPPGTPGTLPSLRKALLIGIAQVTAILPGLSRSGMTISSALLLGLDRAMAARFSFLISVIAVSGAVAKEVLDLVREPADPTPVAVAPFVVGFFVSLVVGLAALRGLLLIVGRGRIMGFVVYLAVLGGLAIALG